MTLYEIDKQISEFPFDVDDNGEILNIEDFEALQMARDAKIEGVALYIKELIAERDAIKAERDNLNERMKSKERKADSLKRYLAQSLAGEKFESPKVKVSYRKSQQVVLAGEFDDWAKDNAPDLLSVSTVYKPDKAAIKEAIKSGRHIEGAALIDNVSMQIK